MSTRRTITANLAVLFTSQATTLGLGVAIVLLLPRQLGAAGLGRLAFGQSVAAIVLAVVLMGTNGYVVREVARRPGSGPRLAATAMALRAVVWLPATAVALVLLGVRRTPAPEVALTAILCVTALVTAQAAGVGAALQGMERMARTSAAAVTDAAVVLVLGAPVLVVTRSPLAFAGALLAGAVLSLIVNLGGMRPGVLFPELPRPRQMAGLAIAAAPFTAMAVAQGLYSQVDVVLLGVMADDRAVGWFSAAVRLSPLFLMVPVVIGSALMPTMARLQATAPDDARAVFRRLLELTLVVVVPMGVGVSLVAPRMVDVLRGVLFEESGPVLAVLGFAWVATSLGMVLGSGLLAAGRQRAWSIASVAITAAFLAFNAVAIPVAAHRLGNPAVGAAAADLAAELIMVATAVLLQPRGTLHLRTLGYAARVVGATSLMGATVLLMPRSVPVFLVIAVAASIYGAAALALRVISTGEVRALVATVRSRPGRPAAAPEPAAAA